MCINRLRIGCHRRLPSSCPVGSIAPDSYVGLSVDELAAYIDRVFGNPFELTIKDEWAYARGITDDSRAVTRGRSAQLRPSRLQGAPISARRSRCRCRPSA